MTASNRTVEEVMKVLLKHLSQEQIVAILADLRKVQGNSSFKQTIEAMWRHTR